MFRTDYDAQSHREMEREEWLEEGRKIEQKKLIRLIRRKLDQSMSPEDIADLLEENAEPIKMICDVIQNHPNWSDAKICENIKF